MHIIRPQQGQTIRCITRNGLYASVSIFDESQAKNINDDILNISGTANNGYVFFYINFKEGKFPVEGRFYQFTVYDNDGVQYKGRLFCTAQTEYDKYTVNENVYTEEESYDNEFVII